VPVTCAVVLNTVCSLVRYRGLLLTEGGEDSREDSRDTGSTSLVHADPAVGDAYKGCLEKVPHVKSIWSLSCPPAHMAASAAASPAREQVADCIAGPLLHVDPDVCHW